MIIRTATAHADGSVCLILDKEDHAESDSVILEYRPDRTPAWRRFEPGEQIDAVCSVPEGYNRPGRFVAMTPDGDLLDILEGLPRSFIAGAGYDRPDSLKRGNMTAMELVAGKPTALGFGGQVYVMAPNGTFSPISTGFPDPEENAEDTVKFMSGTHSARQGLYYFVGSVVTASPDSDAIDAANDAGDADLLAELMLAETRYDYGAAFTFDGTTWSAIEAPGNTEFDETTTAATGDVYVREREGKLYQIPQPEEWAVVLDVDTDTGLSGLTTFAGDAVVATETELIVASADGGTPFDPPMPAADGYFVEFGTGDHQLFVFRSAAILFLENGVWATLEVPPELAVLG